MTPFPTWNPRVGLLRHMVDEWAYIATQPRRNFSARLHDNMTFRNTGVLYIFVNCGAVRPSYNRGGVG